MKFSIVIPTRNRAGLLRHALATAVAIDHDDLEIVVSDNASHDDTREVATATGDPRVRCVRSDVPLTNAESWEFAVSHAQGEWVTVLGDDDGFVPSVIDRVEAVVEARPERPLDLVVWNPAWYVHPDTEPAWPVAEQRNTLSVHGFSGATYEVDAAEQLRRLFDRTEDGPLPSVVNGFVRRTVLDEIRARSGRVFGEPDPSWSLAAALLACIDRYAVVDLPLTVAGVSPVNIGGAFLRNRRDHSTAEEFDRPDLFALTPLQTRTCANLAAESLLRRVSDFPAELGRHQLSLPSYFVAARLELGDPQRAGDGGAGIVEWKRVVASQPRDIRVAVRRSLRRLRARAGVRAAARRIPGAARLRRLPRTPPEGGAFRYVSGAANAFGSLDEAAAWLDAHVLPAPQPVSGRSQAAVS